MTTRTAPTSAPNRTTSVWCGVESCRMPVDGNFGGLFCAAHRRALRFSATLNDALIELLGTGPNMVRPNATNQTDLREAGEHFAIGLAKVFGPVFNTTVLVDPEPITLDVVKGSDSQVFRWHVSLKWKAETHDGPPILIEDDDSDDEYNDDNQDEDSEGHDDE